MKTGLYYHPGRIKSDQCPVIMNAWHHREVKELVILRCLEGREAVQYNSVWDELIL
ncbi:MULTISPECIES: hypothetical protein [Paenibacillus]|uniref:hypothetical protein n=1 Tax=Paenibacillus TaxID=44249 RepID=UPI0008E87485|nr:MULTISPECIES: hypothetical protein [Paenibacillus]SFQ96504.1 hypothetical protein SAMN04488603_101182 [Paenibacillus sp. cl130]